MSQSSFNEGRELHVMPEVGLQLNVRDFMKVKLITLVSDLGHPGWLQLKRSLDHFGWDYDVINKPYVFFGSKMVYALEYAKQTDCTHLFVVDGYDTFVLDTMGAAVKKMPSLDAVIFNAEKNCWPDSELSEFYPNPGVTWRFLNGGIIFSRTDLLIKLLENCQIEHFDNDQKVFSGWFVAARNDFSMKLDVKCKVFQSVAFAEKSDFCSINGRLVNRKTATTPVIIHANGGVNETMEEVYKLLPE